MKVKNSFSNYFLIVLFLVALSSAFIQNAFKLIPEMANTENRRLSYRPILDIKLLDPFPAAYESFYNDHFAFRNQFVKLYADVSLDVFGKCPYPDQVVIGRNNELFLVFRELDTYLHKNLFTKSEINKIHSEFKYRKQYLAERGIDYYVALLPTKYSVYPELLPWYFNPVDTLSRSDQFINLMQELDIQVIDVKSAILKAKDSIPQQLYLKTDNHWNDLGSFAAYREIVNRISAKHPEVKALKYSDYTINPEEINGGNMAIILNKQEEIKDIKYVFTPRFKNLVNSIPECPYPIPDQFEKENYFRGYYTENTALPRVLIFHDSFGNNLMAPMSNSFSRTIFVWDKWQYKLNEAIVESEKPDIYITLTLESLLQSLADNCEYR
jgi:hypothetical protein